MNRFNFPRRCRLTIRAALLAPPALAAAIAWSSAAAANGWEHATVPFETLVKALNFEGPATRARAAASLGYREQPAAVEPLLKRLAKTESNRTVRRAIYGALGRIGDPRAVPVLLNCLNNEEREEVRGDCVAAIGRIGEPSSFDQLLMAFREDPAFMVRGTVVDALGGFSSPGAVAFLVDVLTQSRNRNLRRRAIRALGRTGAQEAVDPLLATLAEAKRDEDRLPIVKALAALRSPKATKPLSALLTGKASPELRVYVAIALGATKDGSAVRSLAKLLLDEIPEVRFFAVSSLATIGDRAAAEPIREAARTAASRLANLDLRNVGNDADEIVAELNLQTTAIRALAELGPADSLDIFLSAAQPRAVSRDSAPALKVAEAIYELRRVALYALGHTRSREAARFLNGEAGIGGSDHRLRATAARSLGVLGFPDAADVLLPLLDDPAADVRWTTASLLGRLGDTLATEALVQSLADPAREVRRQAAFSLGYLQARQALPALERLGKEDASPLVREAAAFSVSLLRGLE